MSSEWKIYRTRFLVRARQLTTPMTFVDLLGREHRGQAGDYLVETSDGVRRIPGNLRRHLCGDGSRRGQEIPAGPAQFHHRPASFSSSITGGRELSEKVPVEIGSERHGTPTVKSEIQYVVVPS